MFNAYSWSQAAAHLKQHSIDLTLFSQRQSADEITAFIEKTDVDMVIGRLFRDLPQCDTILEYTRDIKWRLGLGQEMPLDFSTFSVEQIAEFDRYLTVISVDNYANSIKYIAACAGADISFDPPQPVRSDGIYHPDASGLFENVSGCRSDAF